MKRSDTGQPVKIMNLAREYDRLSYAVGIKLLETRLRPGESKEELLVKTEELTNRLNETDLY